MEEKEFKEMRISFVPMDYAACGLYRIRNPFYALYLSCKACLQSAGTFPAGSDVIYTQRLCNSVTMDLIHQMAGKTLHFKGEVVSVSEATEKELTEGLHGEFVHTCGCGGCHGHDGNCGGCEGGHCGEEHSDDCGCGCH